MEKWTSPNISQGRTLLCCPGAWHSSCAGAPHSHSPKGSNSIQVGVNTLLEAWVRGCVLGFVVMGAAIHRVKHPIVIPSPLGEAHTNLQGHTPCILCSASFSKNATKCRQAQGRHRSDMCFHKSLNKSRTSSFGSVAWDNIWQDA